ESVRRVVRETAEKTGAEYIFPDEKLSIICSEPDGVSFDYKGGFFRTAMPGVHQAYNAVSAIETCRYLKTKGFTITEDDIAAGISGARIAARQQFIQGKPPVLVDGGHNPGGVESLAATLRAIHQKKSIFAVLGMVDSKDYRSCAAVIAELADRIYTVDGFAYNSVPAGVLAECLGSHAEACTSLSEAVRKASEKALEDDGMVVVCGSLYLASEYLNNIRK
ncbi:MAG: bifunctional tetrahydrofolate synthase/dihydrofolate synthase, partial [Clostridia bacterium]|nr:bifunctional tetrahydrofolate synthase/dihydrofolate synthase [Clostridia bacterium]